MVMMVHTIELDQSKYVYNKKFQKLWILYNYFIFNFFHLPKDSKKDIIKDMSHKQQNHQYILKSLKNNRYLFERYYINKIIMTIIKDKKIRDP